MTEAENSILLGSECVTCGEGLPQNECPKSQRACGHHCNCSWEQDICHWCGAETDDEGVFA